MKNSIFQPKNLHIQPSETTKLNLFVNRAQELFSSRNITLKKLNQKLDILTSALDKHIKDSSIQSKAYYTLFKSNVDKLHKIIPKQGVLSSNMYIHIKSWIDYMLSDQLIKNVFDHSNFSKMHQQVLHIEKHSPFIDTPISFLKDISTMSLNFKSLLNQLCKFSHKYLKFYPQILSKNEPWLRSNFGWA